MQTSVIHPTLAPNRPTGVSAVAPAPLLRSFDASTPNPVEIPIPTGPALTLASSRWIPALTLFFVTVAPALTDKSPWTTTLAINAFPDGDSIFTCTPSFPANASIPISAFPSALAQPDSTLPL